MEPGRYTLVVSKSAHLRFTINNIVVENEDIDLRQSDRNEVRLIRLICGDLNGDGKIDSGDLSMLLGSYLKLGENILADLNGDGQVNSCDLLILLANYLKLDVVVDWLRSF